jgi:pilus assembly protein Flp/PilA
MCSIEGATAVEYALMVALIALVIVGAVVALGTATSDAMCGPVPTLGGGPDGC